MKVYMTRHGQVSKAEYINDNEMLPRGEVLLSELGCEQAHMLGEHLKELGFCGDIISSPYLRTMTTAQIIAEHVGSKIYPYAPFREMMFTDESAQEHRSFTLEQLREKFPAVANDAVLDYPWWTMHTETMDDVFDRVKAGVEALEERDEVLFVGHGASLGALEKYYELKRRSMVTRYNCSLAFIDTKDESAEQLYWDTSFMPYEKVTSNFKTREEIESDHIAKSYSGEISLPEGFEVGRRYLLHIGDTNAWHYRYFRKLIELTKPEVIVHTGDMADEVKVGRIPGTEYEYLFKVGKLLEIFENSGARRVIVVPGNNDLPDEVKKRMPRVEIMEQGEIFTDGKFSFWIKHYVNGLDSDADFMLYGHSLKNDRWNVDMNAVGSQCRFNALWGSFLIDLDSGEFYCFKRP